MSHDPSSPSIWKVRRRWAFLLGGVLAITGAFFEFGRAGEPEFVDEWAYVSQAYFGPLLLKPSSPLWLEYPAYDLPPLPKYAIAAALTAAGQPLPGPPQMRRWYADTSSRFGPHSLLAAARIPSVWFGALGCAALAAIGGLSAGLRVGLLAAALLALNPLYRMHAHRAMADVPAEALTLATLAIALAALRSWTHRVPWTPSRLVALIVSCGVLSGLAVLAKLNGGLALMILAAWALAAFVFLQPPTWRRLVPLVILPFIGLVAFATFTLLNPFLTAHPPRPGTLPPEVQSLARMSLIDRTRYIINHRVEASRAGRTLFPADAVNGLPQALPVIALQGFGRFGPLGQKRDVPLAQRRDPDRQLRDFDSRIRFDPLHQDLGAFFWLPLVLLGLALYTRDIWTQPQTESPPLPWPIPFQAAVTLATVALFLPLAWDRYLMPLQPIASLLGARALVGLFDRLRPTRSHSEHIPPGPPADQNP